MERNNRKGNLRRVAAVVVGVVLRLLFPVTALVLPGNINLLHAQTNTPPPPDCIRFFSFTLHGSGTQTQAVQDNRSVGCTTWTVAYQATGTGAITGLTFQSAPGASVAGTWVTYAGTVDTGYANPMTSSVGQVAHFSNGAVDTPWLRVSLAEGTFVGVLNGVYYGYRQGYPGNASSGGSGCSSPCVVIGPDAAGATPTQSPVQLSMVDAGGKVIRPVATATGQYVQGAAAAGAAVTQNPVTIGAVSAAGLARNIGTPNAATNTAENGTISLMVTPSKLAGTTYNKDFVCNLSAAITISAATDVVIIPSGGGSLITKICHISFSSGTAADVTIRQGTGVTCGTSQVALTGAYANVLTFALDFRAEAALQNTVAARDTCLHFSTSVTAGGVVQYAQFAN